MKPLRSSLFIVCLVLFIAHQLMQKVLHINCRWLDNYFDNLVAMPVILSLWQAERILVFKKADNYQLSVVEIVIATLYIILVTEIVFPLFSKDFKSDWLDIIFYFTGSLLFYLKDKGAKGIKVLSCFIFFLVYRFNVG